MDRPGQRRKWWNDLAWSVGRRLGRRRLAAPVLAVAAPAFVLGVGLYSVAHFSLVADDDGLEELAHAGRVLNGERIDGSTVQAIEAALRAFEPEVLVLGNSTAHSNVDVDALAEALDVSPDRMLTVSMPNSVASHWYAVLANRVFANGHQPKVVVVVGSLRSALLSEPYSTASRQSLLVHMEPEEPILDRHVHRGLPALEALQWRRAQLRSQLLVGARDLAVTYVFGDSSAEPAMAKVFHHSRLSGSASVADGAAEVQYTAAEIARALLAPEDSLLPAMADLASTNGSTLVVVRPPMAPRTPDARRDVTLAGVPDRVSQTLASRGHRFVDLGDHWMPGRMYDNLVHMSEAGAVRFTRDALGPAVADLRLSSETTALVSAP